MSHEKFIFYIIEYLLKTKFDRKSINYSRSDSSRSSQESSKESSSREQSVAKESSSRERSVAENQSIERQSLSFRFSKFFQSSELSFEFSYERSSISSSRSLRFFASSRSLSHEYSSSILSRSFISSPSFSSLNQSIRTQSGHDRELVILTKLYSDEIKYSDENDSFSFKLIIFHDMCARVDVSHSVKLKAFFIMLKGLALNFYYSNMSISAFVIFDEVCYSMSNYFENAEYKRSILTR